MSTVCETTTLVFSDQTDSLATIPNPSSTRLEQVNAHGLAALARGLKNLTELDVGGCEKVDDSALRALCSMNAQFLNLSGCSAITETGVTGIAMNCTALSSLNVTG